ncbi:MAG: DUF5615 family PIN-like protein [Pseudomonadota bacterium]
MTFRFLIDECLSPELVAMARQAGHLESFCVRDRGWVGKKDWQLMEHVLEEDLTLVTHNAKDFRGAGPNKLGGFHAKAPIHAGLVCLTSKLSPMDIDRQKDLFGVALDVLANHRDLINQALDVLENEDASVSIVLYEIPALSNTSCSR